MQYTLKDAFRVAEDNGVPLIFEYMQCEGYCERCKSFVYSVDEEYSIIGNESVHREFEKEYGFRVDLDTEVEIIRFGCGNNLHIIARYFDYKNDDFPTICELCKGREYIDMEHRYYPTWKIEK